MTDEITDVCVASYTMAEEQGHSEEEHFEEEHFVEEHFDEEYEVEEHEEHFEEEHIEKEGRRVEYNTPPRAKKFINWLELPNMALDINQSGSRNFRSSSVVYRTQSIVSTVKCAKEILAVAIKVSPI